MAVVRKGGKKGRKIGRQARRPSTARRKGARLDLYRKARRVLRHNGETALDAWVAHRYEAGELATLLHSAAKRARDDAARRVA